MAPVEIRNLSRHRVGAVLEDASFHPGRTARNHLRVLATTGGHPAGRVDEVLAEVGGLGERRHRGGGSKCRGSTRDEFASDRDVKSSRTGCVAT